MIIPYKLNPIWRSQSITVFPTIGISIPILASGTVHWSKIWWKDKSRVDPSLVYFPAKLAFLSRLYNRLALKRNIFALNGSPPAIRGLTLHYGVPNETVFSDVGRNSSGRVTRPFWIDSEDREFVARSAGSPVSEPDRRLDITFPIGRVGNSIWARDGA